MTPWGWIAFAAMFLLLMAQTWYYISRVWELRQQHQLDMALKDEENLRLMQTVKQTEIQARVLGSAPVSRLIGAEDE